MNTPVPPEREQPVSRPRVLLGAVCLVALLAGVVATAELLRHPPAVEPSPLEAEATDVRDELTCPDAAIPSQPVPAGPSTTAAIRVSSGELYDCPETYDGRAVMFEGEVVGALLPRRTGVWAQLNDDVYATHLGALPTHRDFRGGNAGVGVFLTGDLADVVAAVGGPQTHGDVLRVTGTFERLDEATGEVAVIRATAATVTSRGSPIDHEPVAGRRLVGVVLAFAAGGLAVSARRARRR